MFCFSLPGFLGVQTAEGGGEEDVDGMAAEDEEVEGPTRHIVKHKVCVVDLLAPARSEKGKIRDIVIGDISTPVGVILRRTR